MSNLPRSPRLYVSKGTCPLLTSDHQFNDVDVSVRPWGQCGSGHLSECLTSVLPSYDVSLRRLFRHSRAKA